MILVIAILIVVGLLVVCLGDALFEWLFEEYPVIGFFASIIVIALLIYAIVELFSMSWV